MCLPETRLLKTEHPKNMQLKNLIKYLEMIKYGTAWENHYMDL